LRQVRGERGNEGRVKGKEQNNKIIIIVPLIWLRHPLNLTSI